MKKLEIEKTKPNFSITVSKVEYKADLVSSISSFFINKMSLANKWMRKKYLLAVIQLYETSKSKNNYILALVLVV